jgi:hypothetical protein
MEDRHNAFPDRLKDFSIRLHLRTRKIFVPDYNGRYPVWTSPCLAHAAVYGDSNLCVRLSVEPVGLNQGEIVCVV